MKQNRLQHIYGMTLPVPLWIVFCARFHILWTSFFANLIKRLHEATNIKVSTYCFPHRSNFQTFFFFKIQIMAIFGVSNVHLQKVQSNFNWQHLTQNAQGYLKNHWVNCMLACTHLNYSQCWIQIWSWLEFWKFYQLSVINTNMERFNKECVEDDMWMKTLEWLHKSFF